MKRHIPQFIITAFITPLAILGLSKAAWADRPWQNAPVPAYTVGDYKLELPLSSALTALPDGSPFTLNTEGKLYRLDLVDGHLSVLSEELPPLSALTSNNQGLWGVSQTKTIELLNIAPDTGVILNHISLKDSIKPNSFISALQVADDKAYLVDEAMPAFITVDLRTGQTQRLLDGSPSLLSHKPLIRHGMAVIAADGTPRSGGNVRFLELDRSHNWLFYQTPTGPLYRMGTNILSDSTLGPAEQIEAMTNWRRTPSLGGLTMSADDTLYLVDIEHGDLLAFGADRIPLRLLHDDRLYGAQAIHLVRGDSNQKKKAAILFTPPPTQEEPPVDGQNTPSTPAAISNNHTHLLEIALP